MTQVDRSGDVWAATVRDVRARLFAVKKRDLSEWTEAGQRVVVDALVRDLERVLELAEEFVPAMDEAVGPLARRWCGVPQLARRWCGVPQQHVAHSWGYGTVEVPVRWCMGEGPADNESPGCIHPRFIKGVCILCGAEERIGRQVGTADGSPDTDTIGTAGAKDRSATGARGRSERGAESSGTPGSLPGSTSDEPVVPVDESSHD